VLYYKESNLEVLLKASPLRVSFVGFLKDFIKHPGRGITLTIVVMVSIWSIAWISIAVQVGKPFPGFFYNPMRVFSSFTPLEFTGWQAGLRPWDVIVAVNGQHWREMSRLVKEAGIGNTLIYTIERDGQRLDIPVQTMLFTKEILFRFLPGYFVSSLVFLLIGIFVYLKNPSAAINRYLLAYLLIWSIGGAIIWECFLSQNKWMGYLLIPYAIAAPVAGWIFFWSFPADRARVSFLKRWSVIKIFVFLGVGIILWMLTLQVLANLFDHPFLWKALTFLMSWPYYVVFGLCSFVIKGTPLIVIIARKGNRLLRSQATVMLAGLMTGLTAWHLFLWAPAAIHLRPVVSTQLAGLIPAVYPLSIGYAILRYQLLNIRVVMRKGLVYSLLTTVLTAAFVLMALLVGFLFHLFVGRQSLLAMVIPALSLAFFFHPIRQRIQALVDKAFFRREYEVYQTLTRFSQGLTMLRRHSEVIRLVKKTITETLGARDTILWLPKNGDFEPADENRGPSVMLLSSGELVYHLSKARSLFSPYPDEEGSASDELRRIGAELAVPLFFGEKLVGILTLASRQSGEPFSQEDKDLLSMLAHSTALALENARLYEEHIDLLHQQFLQNVEIQEEERCRIARELHDGVAPSLASLNIRLQTMRKQLERERHPAVGEVEELAQQVQANIQDIRRLIYDLRPTALDEIGLVPALQEYTAHFQRDQGIAVQLICPEDLVCPSPATEITLFRVIQEALANIAKHAHANEVIISLERTRAGISLIVQDNGQGFNLQAPISGNHIGLWSMQRRVENLGGCLRLQSVLGYGTQVSVQIPLEETGQEGIPNGENQCLDR
jgi:signal transduction histidine kinase